MTRKLWLSNRRLHRTAVGPSAVVCAALLSSCDVPAPVLMEQHTHTQALRGGVPVAMLLGERAAAVATIVDDNDAVVCTATFVAPHHVVTAAHCFQPGLSALEQATFLQGLWLTTSTNVHLALVTVSVAPDADAAVVAVAGTSDVFLPVRDDVAADDVATVYVVGAGRGADASDRRAAEFAVRDDAPLWTLSPTSDDGLCPGDSGGPLLVPQNGSWAVVGVHKSGQFDCLGDGHATPLTGRGDWIADVVATAFSAGDSCSDEQSMRCVGTVVERCVHGVWRGADCALAQYQCLDDERSAACVPTPCGDVSAAGECDGSTALTCRFGSLWRELCGAADICALDEEQGRMGCVPCPNICDDVCVSLLDDDAHCGDCATACTDGERCHAGSCVATSVEGEGEGEGEEGEGEREVQTSEGCAGSASPSLLVFLITLPRRVRARRFRR